MQSEIIKRRSSDCETSKYMQDRFKSTEERNAIKLVASSLGMTLKNTARLFVDFGESFASFSVSVKSAKENIRRFGTEIQFINASIAWSNRSKGRMPGSQRTARLRKKRKSKVNAWYRKEVLDAK